MKMRVQGESHRIEDCPEGGQHVLKRPVQKYCVVCRPKKKQQTLERQRKWRAEQRAKKAGLATTGAPPAEHLTDAPPVTPERRILDLARELHGLTYSLVTDYESAERAIAPDTVDRAAELNALVAQVLLAARRLRPGSAPADELAIRRERSSR